MKSIDFLIIGGSAAGTTAAEVIRSLKPQSSITIVTDENHEEYSRVLLPHYIRGEVTREQVFLKKPEWYHQNNIELLKGFKAHKLDPDKKLVTFAPIQNHSGGEQIQYGKLLIAIGGKVIKLDVPGAELGNILYMRTIEDADEIIRVAQTAKRGVIIGGGFIGLEFTSCFKINGVSEVTVLVMEDYYWQGKLDRDSARVLQNTLEKNGVKVLVNEEVDRFESRGSTPGADSLALGVEPLKEVVGAVKTKSGQRFEADVVGIGIGIKSDLSWLSGSGIKINRAIVTNEYLETNLPDVYAVGDCAEFWDVVFGRQHVMGNWANATSQGSAVGKTMVHSASSGQAGQRTVFETASSYSINYFDPPAGGFCTFIGVTDEKFADEVASRGSVEEGKMTRIFIKKFASHTSEVGSDSSEVNKNSGQVRIVGATVINDPSQVSPLTSAVKGKVDISQNKNKLSDPQFDLRDLLV